ncbi:replication factor A protein 3 [Stereum hirsutum FP-91666 SS1]|uniref:replication factor A protein 3 n=1 Tax=Stereum hirsutum (strain FP-91666) TaxID=721885 RepID=UPI000440FC92|nr:replication factor A protein 3 [Stereum hirsutum FP-91666 SS1]EIM89139.1 replication factor A protein 3 [Stereum hirsutum FP-91666 SS1]
MSSPRVNSARMPEYVGKTVRIVGKMVEWAENGEFAIMETSDGGQVTVQLAKVDMDAMNDTYFEVIGTPVDGSTIKMVNCCNLGDHLNLKLANDVIELTHDKRFKGRMF